MSLSLTRLGAVLALFIPTIVISGLFAASSFSQDAQIDDLTPQIPCCVSLILDHDRRIVYSTNYSFNEFSHFYWTIDDNIISTTNFYTVSPAVQCPPANPNCSDPQLQVSFDVSRYCDGEYHHLSAIARQGNSELLAGLQGNPFTCTGGGASLPTPTQQPVVFVPGIMGSVI